MADQNQADELATLIRYMASESNKSLMPFLQVAATFQQSRSALEFSKTAILFAQSIQEFQKNNQTAINHLFVTLAGIRESLKPATFAFAQLASQYYESIKPVVEALSQMTIPQQTNAERAGILEASESLLDKVGAYAKRNPSVIVVDETGKDTRAIDMMHKIQTQVDGLNAKMEQMATDGTKAEKKNFHIGIIFFILSVFLPQLLFGGGTAEHARKELQKDVSAIIERFHQGLDEIGDVIQR